MSACTWESHHAITTLMYHYAECVDAADFDGIAGLFVHGRITNEGVDGAIEGSEAVRALYAGTNRVHADGTLRTRHLTTNVIVDIDEISGSATARSAFVVFQQTPELPLQPIVAGRYRDEFARAGNEWRFDRRHIFVDQIGDVREHLSFDLSGFMDKR
ncbi:MAG TPA: nuclear transport factor 2 family protein [Acidimicrobiia bacterium]|nr:nuclear transport factor 2 family protein [Acidimicrobiia bacterium]